MGGARRGFVIFVASHQRSPIIIYLHSSHDLRWIFYGLANSHSFPRQNTTGPTENIPRAIRWRYPLLLFFLF